MKRTPHLISDPFAFLQIPASHPVSRFVNLVTGWKVAVATVTFVYPIPGSTLGALHMAFRWGDPQVPIWGCGPGRLPQEPSPLLGFQTVYSGGPWDSPNQTPKRLRLVSVGPLY